jgi:hypothetical protein
MLVGKVQIGAIHNKTCAQKERAARRSPSVCASLLPSEGKAKPTLPAKAGGCGTKRGRLAGSPNSVMTTIQTFAARRQSRSYRLAKGNRGGYAKK